MKQKHTVRVPKTQGEGKRQAPAQFLPRPDPASDPPYLSRPHRLHRRIRQPQLGPKSTSTSIRSLMGTPGQSLRGPPLQLMPKCSAWKGFIGVLLFAAHHARRQEKPTNEQTNKQTSASKLSMRNEMKSESSWVQPARLHPKQSKARQPRHNGCKKFSCRLATSVRSAWKPAAMEVGRFSARPHWQRLRLRRSMAQARQTAGSRYPASRKVCKSVQWQSRQYPAGPGQS